MKQVMKFTGKILIVDDEKVNVDFFHVMLSRLGFQVDTAYDGEEALKRVKVFNPDLILLDLLMPRLSGFDVARILKKDKKTKNIPIIILTAIDDIKEKVDMLELGIEDYITKPFNFIEILARIRSNLRSKLLNDEMLRRERRLNSIRDFENSIKLFIRNVHGHSKNLIAVCKLAQGKGDSESNSITENMISIGRELLSNVGEFELEFNNFVNTNRKMEEKSVDISSLDDIKHDLEI